MDGKGEKQRCVIFCISHAPLQAPSEDLGVNAARRGLQVCVCVWQVGGFSKMGGLVSDGGRRSYCLPDLYHRGMDHQMYMCVRESVLCCAGRACRLCIGRVHQHVVR